MPIQSITINLSDLLQYNAADGANDNVDLPTDEDEWDSENDDNDDSDIYYSLDDKLVK